MAACITAPAVIPAAPSKPPTQTTTTPSMSPTLAPTTAPTRLPTKILSISPSVAPTQSPTAPPTAQLFYSPIFGQSVNTTNPFSYICPPGTYVSQITGSALDVVYAMRFYCSDGVTSSPPFFGGGAIVDNSQSSPFCSTTGFSEFDVALGAAVVGQIVSHCSGVVQAPMGSGSLAVYGGLKRTATYTCPRNTLLVGVKGSFSPSASSALIPMSSVVFICGYANTLTPTAAPTAPTASPTPESDVVYTGTVGQQNPTQTPFSFMCPYGTYVTTITGGSGNWVGAISLTCSNGTSSPIYGDNDGGPYTVVGPCLQGYAYFNLRYSQFIGQIDAPCSGRASPLIGKGAFSEYGADYNAVRTCPGDRVLVGFSGSTKFQFSTGGSQIAGPYLNTIEFVCQNLPPTVPHYSPFIGIAPTIQTLPSVPFNFMCRTGAYITQMGGRAGDWLEAINVTCSDGITSPLYGSTGGNGVNSPLCPQGYSSFNATWGAPLQLLNQHIFSLVPYCGGNVITTNTTTTAVLGPGGGVSTVWYTCPPRAVLIGVSGSYSSTLDTLVLICQVLPPTNPPTSVPTIAPGTTSLPTVVPTISPTAPTPSPTTPPPIDVGLVLADAFRALSDALSATTSPPTPAPVPGFDPLNLAGGAVALGGGRHHHTIIFSTMFFMITIPLLLYLSI